MPMDNLEGALRGDGNPRIDTRDIMHLHLVMACILLIAVDINITRWWVSVNNNRPSCLVMMETPGLSKIQHITFHCLSSALV